MAEDEFLKSVIGHFQQAEETGRRLKEKKLNLLFHAKELDGLFKRIYEDGQKESGKNKKALLQN